MMANMYFDVQLDADGDKSNSFKRKISISTKIGDKRLITFGEKITIINGS